MKELRTPSGLLAGKYGYESGRMIFEYKLKKTMIRLTIGLDGIRVEEL